MQKCQYVMLHKVTFLISLEHYVGSLVEFLNGTLLDRQSYAFVLLYRVVWALEFVNVCA